MTENKSIWTASGNFVMAEQWNLHRCPINTKDTGKPRSFQFQQFQVVSLFAVILKFIGISFKDLLYFPLLKK